MGNRNSQIHIAGIPSFSIGTSKSAEADRKRSEKIKARLLSENKKFFEEYLLALLEDVHNKLHRLYGVADYLKDRDTIKIRVRSEGAYFCTHVLPCLITDCLNLLEEREAWFPGFKLNPGTNYPLFCRRLFNIVLSRRHDAETEAIALQGIYMISVAFKKLNGPYSDELLKQQFEGFVDVDQQIGDLDIFSDELYPIINRARSRWGVFAHDIALDHESCRPRPGPGATVDNVPKSLRYAPQRLFNQLDQSFPVEEWFFPPNPWDLVQQSRKFLSLERITYPYSEFLFVPKTAGKPRGICKEFNEAQFVQQALRSLLTWHIKKKLSGNLPLDDQSVHGRLAIKASADRESATIDESEASDRIARLVVSWLSQDNVELHNALMSASTKYILPPKEAADNTLLKTHKFAPMGSGICFPVMSLVHLFLVQAIIIEKMDDRTLAERQELANAVSVYGDDIILPTSAVTAVYEWLPRFGMKINQDKSYAKSHFRESCGMHGYKGHDITPVYCRYTTSSPHPETGIKEQQLLSLVATESLLYKKGFLQTARYLRRCMHTKWKKTKLSYVSNASPILGFKREKGSPDIVNLKHEYRTSWDRDLQCYVHRVPVLAVRSKSGIIPQSDAYFRALVHPVAAEVTHTDQIVALEDSPLFAPFGPMQGPPAKFSNLWVVADSTLQLKAVMRSVPESTCYALPERVVRKRI